MAAAARIRSTVPAWLQRDPVVPGERPAGSTGSTWRAGGVVLVAFFFRLWRLEIPRHTHFDEVYHARSATEWLADWQEGWTRDTYEWTHPPLAKYLIAAGIVLADPNKVVRGDRSRRPGHAMAVAPQRTAETRPSRSSSLAGDDGITAREVLTGEDSPWRRGARSPAWPTTRTGNRLLVGLGV